MNSKITDEIGANCFDTVIFEQILWYILEGIDDAVKNTTHLLKNDGNLIVSNAFSREQRYGKAIIDGYPGAVKYFSSLSNLTLVASHYYDDGLRNTDAHFLLKRN